MVRGVVCHAEEEIDIARLACLVPFFLNCRIVSEYLQGLRASLEYFSNSATSSHFCSYRTGVMPLDNVEKIVRKDPLENYYDVGNELGR